MLTCWGCTLSRRIFRKSPMHPSSLPSKAPREHRCCWGSVCPFARGKLRPDDSADEMLNWEALSPCQRGQKNPFGSPCNVQIKPPAQPEEDVMAEMVFLMPLAFPGLRLFSNNLLSCFLCTLPERHLAVPLSLDPVWSSAPLGTEFRSAQRCETAPLL